MHRVKVLACHGRYQNAQICLEKLAGVRVSGSTQGVFRATINEEPKRQVEIDLEGYNQGAAARATIMIEPAGKPGLKVDLVGLDAPHLVKPLVRLTGNKSLKMKERDPTKLGPRCQTRAWWKDGSKADPKEGLAESLALVQNIYEDHLEAGDPFDGVIGFSQGASLSSILCSTKRPKGVEFRFGVFCSGYPFSEDIQFESSFPSLHIFSELDRMILAKDSESLAEKMQGISRLHNSGHHVPAQFSNVALYEFIQDMFAPV